LLGCPTLGKPVASWLPNTRQAGGFLVAQHSASRWLLGCPTLGKPVLGRIQNTNSGVSSSSVVTTSYIARANDENRRG
ncbi:MAG: hypothetical protein KJ587_18045, partial [Alphaproteobacteria bacterium]|nr:hypothetical protein [Alphaproteobacteria bacterium]